MATGFISTAIGLFKKMRARQPHANSDLVRLFSERIRALATNGPVRFAPGPGNLSGETEEMRAAYREMLGDPFVKSSVLSKTFAVISQDFRVAPPEFPGYRWTPEQHHAAEERARIDHHCLCRSSGGIAEIAWNILIGAILSGRSLCEMVFAVEDRGEFAGKIYLRDFKAKDPKTYDIEVDAFLNTTGIVGRYGGTLTRYDPRDFAICKRLSIYGSPGGMSDLRAAYRGWWKLGVIGKLRMIGLDKYTGPFLKATYRDETVRASLEEALSRARADGYITVQGDGTEIEVLDLLPRGTSDFATAEADAAREIVIGIQGAFLQQLEGQTPGGAGNSQVHGATAELFQWDLGREVEKVVNEIILPRLCELNHGREFDPSVLKIGSINAASMTADLQIDVGLAGMGFPLSIAEAGKRYSRVPTTDPNDILKPPPPAGPALPFSDEDDDDIPPRPAVKPRPPLPATKPATAPGESPRATDVVLSGEDGEAVREMLRNCERSAVAKMTTLTRSAAERALSHPTAFLRAKSFFSHEELAGLADALASVAASGELLGRSRIRLLQRAAKSRNAPGETFTDAGASWIGFADPVPPLPPEKAIDYFRKLVPELGIDPKRFGVAMERSAFTAAAAADKIILEKIQGIVRDALSSGSSIRVSAKALTDLLDSAGMSTGNPQYPEMVVRTNLMDSYNTGAMREMQDPDVGETFPVWKYVGIRDGRQGADHEPNFDTYHPAARTFEEVRGDRPFNCRCTFIPIDRWEWSKLQAGGARLSP